MSKSITRQSITLTAAGVAEVLGSAISRNRGKYQGTICAIKVVTPNFTNAITVTVSIYDRNGVQKWSQSAIPEDSGASGHCYYPAWPGVPIEYGEYVGVLPSGAAGAGGGIVTIDMEYFPDAFIGL